MQNSTVASDVTQNACKYQTGTSDEVPIFLRCALTLGAYIIGDRSASVYPGMQKDEDQLLC